MRGLRALTLTVTLLRNQMGYAGERAENEHPSYPAASTSSDDQVSLEGSCRMLVNGSQLCLLIGITRDVGRKSTSS